MTKPHGTDDEIMLMIHLMREQAKRIMAEIIGGLGRIPHTIPSIALLVDYLNHMACTLELMMKLLSGDWRTHDVGQMYERVLGRKHAHPELMVYLEEALKSQKYLFDPAANIGHYIGDGSTVRRTRRPNR